MTNKNIMNSIQKIIKIYIPWMIGDKEAKLIFFSVKQSQKLKKLSLKSNMNHWGVKRFKNLSS